MPMGKTLFEKLWERHVVTSLPGGLDLLYVDLQLLHEGSSPQAFDALREAGRRVRRPDLAVGTVDHRIPTVHADQPVDELTLRSVEAMVRNCRDFGIRLLAVGDPNQGIVHVIGPELGLTRPGITLVCGDSHTCSHGALGALAFGIGTTEVEHVLATQTLAMAKPKAMEVRVEGVLAPDVAAKDVALAIIRATGVGGGIGHVIEYRGSAIRELSMEGRLTVCNMSVEAGARSGLIAPDDATFRFLEGRPYAPKGKQWEAALDDWRSLVTDANAVFDRSVAIDAATIGPSVTWGTNPSQSIAIDGLIPDPSSFDDPLQRAAAASALTYMGLEPGTPITDLKVAAVFIGSCTNARIEDLRAAARVLDGRSVKPGIRALCVPGSRQIQEQARAEGLEKILLDAGFVWGDPGCSMCSGIGGFLLNPGERSASTSNRNFEGRQGPGGRTHLVSPAIAAATAVAGRFCSPKELG